MRIDIISRVSGIFREMDCLPFSLVFVPHFSLSYRLNAYCCCLSSYQSAICKGIQKRAGVKTLWKNEKSSISTEMWVCVHLCFTPTLLRRWCLSGIFCSNCEHTQNRDGFLLWYFVNMWNSFILILWFVLNGEKISFMLVPDIKLRMFFNLSFALAYSSRLSLLAST